MNFKSNDKIIFTGSYDELRKLNKGYAYKILSIPLKNDFIVLDNGYTVKGNEIIPLSDIKENVPIHLRDDLEFLEVYGKYVLSDDKMLNYVDEEFIIKKIEDKDTLLISPKKYSNLTFSVSPEMCVFDERTIALSKFNIGDRLNDNIYKSWEIVDNKTEGVVIDLAKEYKGCKFDNNDFYRAFTNKNGQITFNQIKVSTACICTVEDAAGEKNIFFAKYNGERIKKQGTMVKFKNGMIGEVNDSFKIMDKYLKGMVMTLNLYTTNIMYPIQEIVEIMEDN